MTCLIAIGTILIFTSIVTLIIIFILGIFLGPMLKKHDPMAYKRLFVFFMPFSGVLLYSYAYSKSNIKIFPLRLKRVLTALKYLIPYLMISFVLGCICFLIANGTSQVLNS
ncbi:hypothetical protein Vspart_03144 [Vibrio spartinae]|uniref:Uncharacterized protein n=1 Tax=Vibrio spartinae TaxID=1918945 RepID=A0ABX6R2X8_9VIBR|nr:hypothetical protein Vspart_03144 [Vibrio spartinae]